MTNRYKVWVREPNGERGRFLCRTGSNEGSEDDVGDFVGTPGEIAAKACLRAGYKGLVLVKDFDTNLWYTVDVSITVYEGTAPT